MLLLDGSKGEGGGQILRNAVALAALLGKSIQISNIRANRKVPGLKRQHLTSLELIRDACLPIPASLEGGVVGSTLITFCPPNTCSGDLNAAAPNADTVLSGKVGSGTKRCITGDTKTAGSICLMLQALLPIALFQRTQPDQREQVVWMLKGGTNASMAPQYDYWEHVFLPVFRRSMCIPKDSIIPTLKCRGYFPKGGGELQLQTHSIPSGILKPLALTNRGDVQSVRIRAFYAGKCPQYVARTMASKAKSRLSQQLPHVTISTSIVFEKNAVGSGSGILIVAETSTGCLFGGSGLGDRKKQPKVTGIEAANELLNTLEDCGCVDEYLQDQLIIYMALAEGTSELVAGSLTLHTQSAISTAEKLCGVTFETTRLTKHDQPVGNDGRIPGKHLIRCRGLGFKSQ